MFDLLDDLVDSLSGIEPFILNNLNSLNTVDGEIFRTDIYENDNNTILEIEVPGFKKEDLELNMDHEELVLTGKVYCNKQNKKHFLRKERRQYLGDIQRRFYVGSYRNEDLVANMENDLLTVVLPKEETKITEKKIINIK